MKGALLLAILGIGAGFAQTPEIQAPIAPSRGWIIGGDPSPLRSIVAHAYTDSELLEAVFRYGWHVERESVSFDFEDKPKHWWVVDLQGRLRGEAFTPRAAVANALDRLEFELR